MKATQGVPVNCAKETLQSIKRKTKEKPRQTDRVTETKNTKSTAQEVCCRCSLLAAPHSIKESGAPNINKSRCHDPERSLPS